MSNCLQPHGLYKPWNSPGQNTRVGSCSLLQRIFLTRDQTQTTHIASGFFTIWVTGEALIKKNSSWNALTYLRASWSKAQSILLLPSSVWNTECTVGQAVQQVNLCRLGWEQNAFALFLFAYSWHKKLCLTLCRKSFAWQETVKLGKRPLPPCQQKYKIYLLQRRWMRWIYFPTCQGASSPHVVASMKTSSPSATGGSVARVLATCPATLQMMCSLLMMGEAPDLHLPQSFSRVLLFFWVQNFRN